MRDRSCSRPSSMVADRKRRTRACVVEWVDEKRGRPVGKLSVRCYMWWQPEVVSTWHGAKLHWVILLDVRDGRHARGLLEASHKSHNCSATLALANTLVEEVVNFGAEPC